MYNTSSFDTIQHNTILGDTNSSLQSPLNNNNNDPSSHTTPKDSATHLTRVGCCLVLGTWLKNIIVVIVSINFIIIIIIIMGQVLNECVQGIVYRFN